MERIKDIIRFWKGTADEHMGAFAAQSAFFIFLSFFPIINLIVSLPKLLPFSEEQMIELIHYVLPSSFEEYVANLVSEMFRNSSNSITIISLIIAVWSAAKGLTAVRYGLNEVYRSREARNYFIIRSISAVYTVVFVLIVLLLVPLNMFGTQIALYVFNQFPHFTDVTLLVYSIRSSATFILLFIMFDLLYTIVPSKKLKFGKQLPGAFLAAFLWVSVTKIFSLYIDYYASKSYMYGSLTTVIMLMFWMYFVIYFIFIGAQLNEYLHFCRKRNEEMKVNPDAAQKDDDWEDDDIPDMSYEDTDDTSSITRDASISDKVIDYDEAVSHKKHLIKGKLTNRKKAMDS
ncbi:MAG: YihY/virulence factor BrkB family protein [Eubacterium sp.]|nr:YihY/virulence factor BrkB family protein [Eubacterium sp.]